MKDAGLKEMLFKHYWALGCFVQPEVDIHFQEGIDGQSKAITDVDVYVLRPHPDLYYERILGDCKTLKGMSPISRTLWLRGLMQFLNADTGCLLVAQGTRIEKDHKIAANHMGINLLNAGDFQVYDRSVIFPVGSEHVRIKPSDIYAIKTISNRFPNFLKLTQYLYRTAWKEEGPSELIRHLVLALRQTRAEFDPAKPEHAALLCDASAIFAIGLAEIAGKIFKQYLHPEDKATLAESLRVTLWGGRETYNYYLSMRKRMMNMVPGTHGDDREVLELPEWNLFVQLIRALLDAPVAAFQVPLLLRQMAVDIVNGSIILYDVDFKQLQSLKFAMLTISYLCKAAELPSEYERALVSKLVEIQGRIASVNRKSNLRAASAMNGGDERQEEIKLGPPASNDNV